MSLRLYLDDCSFAHELRRLLREAGHDVETAADVVPPLTGKADLAHWRHAKAVGRAIVTRNPKDFESLHALDPEHLGVIAIYLDNDPTRDMSHRDVVRAIANLEATGVTIAGGFWPLNSYRW